MIVPTFNNHLSHCTRSELEFNARETQRASRTLIGLVMMVMAYNSQSAIVESLVCHDKEIASELPKSVAPSSSDHVSVGLVGRV